jgi:plastocyanin
MTNQEPAIRRPAVPLPWAAIAAGALLGAAFWVSASAPARAAEELFTLTIKGHRFDPELLEVPAGKKFKLMVKNLDDTAEEFDSYDLDREKVIQGGSEGAVFLGPLDPGTYEFFGEFHMDTAAGKLVAK